MTQEQLNAFDDRNRVLVIALHIGEYLTSQQDHELDELRAIEYVANTTLAHSMRPVAKVCLRNAHFEGLDVDVAPVFQCDCLHEKELESGAEGDPGVPMRLCL